MTKYKVGDCDYRDWGNYIVTDTAYQDDICTRCEKDITVKPGFMLSVQSHDHRKENWKVLSGTLSVVLDGALLTLTPGQEIDIAKGAVHTMANAGTTPCVVHEIQEGQCLEEDIHRYWDSNNRPVEQSDRPDVITSITICESLMTQLLSVKKNLMQANNKIKPSL